MSRIALLLATKSRTPAALLAALTLIVVLQSPGKAALDTLPPNALPFSLGYTVTGDFAVASVDLLPEPDAADGDLGYQTGTIHVGTAATPLVPANAEILAAFLYWETIATTPITLDAQFRGLPISLVRVNEQPLVGNFAPCYSQSGNTLYMMRADVLTLLPLQMDENGFPTGRRLVNDKDLSAAGMTAGHTVRLPEVGTGNHTPQSAGASLFLVYRDPDPSVQLRRIVVYDGLKILGHGETGVQRIRGFLQSSTGAQAKLTQIIARGQQDTSDQLTVTGVGTKTDGNLFAGSLSPDSDRAWASPTTIVSASMPGGTADYTNTADNESEYGETVTMTYKYGNTSFNGCHTWAAIAFSTTVKDDDGDGLIDLLEAGPPAGASTLKDPNGTDYPKLWNMGASPAVGHKDLFVEVNSMYAAPNTSYGSSTRPFPLASQDPDHDGVVTDAVGHDHKPTGTVVQLVGDALLRAGVYAHFDLGPSPGSPYLGAGVKDYVIGAGGASGSDTSLARGGESILETHCNPLDPLCQFPAFPGTVSWKYQLQSIRDEFVVPPPDPNPVRRFDPIRNNIFHYLLFAHARGIAKSVWPCLNGTAEAGFPVNDPLNPTAILTCAGGGLTDNPDFHVPQGVSGVSDLPGFNSMVTLGFSRNFLGTEFFQASTVLHELGHSFELWHGGAPPVFTASTAGSVHVDIQPNCKPSYQSSMSYLHQLYGLIDDFGVPHIDYSNTTLGTHLGLIDETTALGNQNLSASGISPRRYRVAWYTPIVAPAGGQPGNFAYLLGVPTATRHCDGTPLLPSELDASGNPIQPVGRLQTASTTPDSIDWAGDDTGFSSGTGLPSDLDVNYDGRKGALQGINDLDRLRLNQLGGGQNAGGFSTGIAYVGTGLTVDGIPYLNGPQYIGGVAFPGGGIAYPGGGIVYPGGGSYIGGIAFGSGGIAFGSGGIAFGGAGIAFGSGGIAFGGAGLPILDGIAVVNYYPGGIAFGSGGIAFGSGGIAFGGGGIAYPGGGIVYPGGGIVYPGGGIAFPGAGIAYPGGGIAFPGGGEITHEDIEHLGHAPPNGVSVCRLELTGDCVASPLQPLHRHLLTRLSSNLDSPDGFRGFRVTGAGVTTTGVALTPDAAPDVTSLLDTEELPNGIPFTYWMKGKYPPTPTSNGLSEPSLPPVTIQAVNLAPKAVDDLFPQAAPPPVTVVGNVFTNDTDDDIGPLGKTKWTAKLVNSDGTPGSLPAGLTFNPNGSFSYTTSFGSVTFYYKVNTGKWTDGSTPMSPDSNVAKVTITISDTTPPTVTNLAVNPPTIWSPNGKDVPVQITGKATDSGGSGVASVVIDVEDEYNTAENRLNNPHDIDFTFVVGVTPGFTFNADGTFSLSIPLTASRLGTDKNGRLYTIYVGAKDGAGNTSWASSTLGVTAHDQNNK